MLDILNTASLFIVSQVFLSDITLNKIFMAAPPIQAHDTHKLPLDSNNPKRLIGSFSPNNGIKDIIVRTHLLYYLNFDLAFI
jgi:hypothetical protein